MAKKDELKETILRAMEVNQIDILLSPGFGVPVKTQLIHDYLIQASSRPIPGSALGISGLYQVLGHLYRGLQCFGLSSRIRARDQGD